MTVERYMVVGTNQDYEKLAEKVNEAIALGWQPIGGISVVEVSAFPSKELCYFQAMCMPVKGGDK